MKKIEFGIWVNQEGLHQVIRFEPVVLGSFGEQRHAQMFLGALTGNTKAQPAHDPALSSEKRPPPKSAALAFDPVPVPEIKPGETPIPVPDPASMPVKACEPIPVPGPEKRTKSAKPAQKSTSMLPVVSDREPSDEDWATALNRIAGGEKVTAVAEAMGLPFGKLRSKWAGAVRLGTHQKPGADNPVSGGVTAVLDRGTGLTWTAEQDAAIVAARPEYLGELAKLYGLSEATVRDRKVALETRLTKMMQEG